MYTCSASRTDLHQCGKQRGQ